MTAFNNFSDSLIFNLFLYLYLGKSKLAERILLIFLLQAVYLGNKIPEAILYQRSTVKIAF